MKYKILKNEIPLIQKFFFLKIKKIVLKIFFYHNR